MARQKKPPKFQRKPSKSIWLCGCMVRSKMDLQHGRDWAQKKAGMPACRYCEDRSFETHACPGPVKYERKDSE